MGAADRDYLRDRPRPEGGGFSPPVRTSAWRIVVLVLLALCFTLPFLLPALR